MSNGFPGMAYVALDAQFLADRRGYVASIAAVQTAAWDHAPWVACFLGKLQAAYEEAWTCCKASGARRTTSMA